MSNSSDYINDYHRESTERLMKEVAEMKTKQFTVQGFIKQVKRLGLADRAKREF